ncbi:hypothetical protein K466DRAFT_607622, partial [Polyporus arcularius HHB13444]
DAWRFKDVDYLTEREGLVLKQLNDAGVPYVPTLLCEAELPGQETKTQLLLPDVQCWWSKEDTEVFAVDPRLTDVVKLHHYRMVVSEVCFAIETCFKTGRQLVSTMRDAIFAHSRAVEVLGRLHCDISPGNIMAYPKIEVSAETGKPTVRWEGMLIDWELNRRVKEHRLPPSRRLLRTWQFVSYQFAYNRRKGLTTADELESFFYVLLYHAIWYLRSNITDAANFDSNFYEHEDGNYSTPGKLHLMHYGWISVDQRPATTPLEFTGLDDRNNVTYTPLDNLVKHLAWLCHAVWRFESHLWNEAMNAVPPFLNDQSRKGCPSPSEKANAAKMIMPSELAEKMDSHSAVLKLFGDALKEPWTMNDYVGHRNKSNLVDAKSDGRDPDGAKKLADAQDPDSAKKPENAQDPDGAKKPADAQCPDSAKKPADAAENVLQPMKVDGRKRAKPSETKGAETLKPPRRNPVRAARKGGPSPDERPARNP